MSRETVVRLLLLVVALNVIRYLVIGPMEQVTIMEPMHRGFVDYPDFFNADFGANDFVISLLYNFSMWVAVVVSFHYMQPALGGPLLVRGLVSFGLSGLFFVSLAAVYMNHFRDHIKPFFFWSMVDAVLVFSLMGVAAGLLYPLFVPARLRPLAVGAAGPAAEVPTESAQS